MYTSLKNRFSSKKKRTIKGPLDLLLQTPNIGRMSEEDRKQMTISCHDTDYIPKVPGAGKINKQGNKRLQTLHNGLVVEADGYVGVWMTEIITALDGHHEPQEEKAFYEVLKRLDKGANMIELGSYWSYYSLWFKKSIKDSVSICSEPDPSNRALGERNAKLNKIKGIEFLDGAVGSTHGGTVTIALDSDPTQNIQAPVLSVDGILNERRIDRLDVLHMDVQGFELDALKGAEDTILNEKLRFLFVSTHHYLFSNSPTTHADCIAFIKERGGHIITSHTIPESFSGDGLIVASFDERDKNFTIETSINHSDASLFRSYEQDLQILIQGYDGITPGRGVK